MLKKKKKKKKKKKAVRAHELEEQYEPGEAFLGMTSKNITGVQGPGVL